MTRKHACSCASTASFRSIRSSLRSQCTLWCGAGQQRARPPSMRLIASDWAGLLPKQGTTSIPAFRCRSPIAYRNGRRRGNGAGLTSTEEIRRLLDIARRYPSPRSPLRPLTLYTMLAVGYCAGLRVGEIARLNLGDVDLEAGTITIRETKFFKSRILPLAGSVVAALRKYLEARRRAGGPQDSASGLFWHDQGAQRYGREAIAWLFVDILRRAALKPPRGKNGPRVHDLRHSMVVNRILAWYRAGIKDRLPFLATYLGHRDINSTLVYITVTQDLLQEAGERFRALGARCLQVAEGTRP